VTRLDRDEPSLNSNLPGDERDTTSPAAMLGAMTKLLTGEVLSSVSRQQLETWLVDSKVGATRLRAGLNPAWRVGTPTGSGEHGATNDVAIVWPLHGSPFLVAVYYTDSTSPAAVRDSVVAEVGAAVSTRLGAGRRDAQRAQEVDQHVQRHQSAGRYVRQVPIRFSAVFPLEKSGKWVTLRSSETPATRFPILPPNP